METANGETSYKLTVEQRLSTLEEQVREIKTNHLVHIQQSLDDAKDALLIYQEKMNAKIDRISWLMVMTLVGLVVNLLQRIL